MISLVASLANLDKLPDEARKAMQGLGSKVRETLVTALSKTLIVAEKVVQSRWPKKSNGEAQTTGYAGQASHITRWSVPTDTSAKAETHTLHATTGSDSPTGTSGQSSNSNSNNAPATGTVIYRGAKEVPLEKQLHVWNEQTKDKNSDLKKKIVAAVSHLKEKLNPLVNAIAKAFKNFNTKLEAAKKIRDTKDSKPQQINAAEGEAATALANLTKAQEAAEPALQQQATLVQACEGDAAGCFAAGTKLWTPLGYQNVEDLLEGDLVYSRNEYDLSGAIEAKPIEKAFRRLAEVQHLHLRGPNGYLVTIRTTGEHPFYAFNRGWMPVKELTNEDWVLTESGDWAKVEDIFATGEMEIVYNLRVHLWHTYFVGELEWGWRVWVHNRGSCDVLADLKQAAEANPVDQVLVNQYRDELKAIVSATPSELLTINAQLHTGKYLQTANNAVFQAALTTADVIRVTIPKLNHEFTSGHAPDFGVTATTWNNGTRDAFRNALISFMLDSSTVQLPGTYRGTIPVIHFFRGPNRKNPLAV